MNRHQKEAVNVQSPNNKKREQRRTGKKRKERKPLQNIVSVRVSDQERKALEKVAASTSKSVSDIMREAIDLWKLQRRRVCLDG
ncbi:ribbon-helix-helix protein, CopG family [Geobacter sp. DSM 9736]|uniref:DUF6290 family protein n=1 Tax=Geobacter sp. DSM 9736 TaxID=1277350 RepID=UPI000B4FFAA7|nr:ribbon-helix-helix protein, CopG family [Geobacter sp. DSM 9736]SNB47849.1 transcriptional regulator, CopG family [Geobacter sp. DSM 9736]